jgi:hypothetical protein
MRTYIYLLMLCTTLGISCKKDAKNTNKAELLTAKAWVVLSEETNVPNTDRWDAEDNPNFKFIVLTFRTDGTYELKHTPNDMSVYGKWNFTENETKIRIDNDYYFGDSQPRIQELSKDRFVFLITAHGETQRVTMVHK